MPRFEGPDARVEETGDRSGGKPLHKQWWLWTGVGVVVVGVMAALLIKRPAREPHGDLGVIRRP